MTNGYHYHAQEEPEYDEESLLTDTIDHEILMHRDAHFGGSFDVMIDYYSDEKVGCHPDIDLERIEYLAGIEKETGKNLAPILLSVTEAEAIAKARKAYKDFKKIYESPQSASFFPRLIADLILSEEEEPVNEIEAILQEGKEIVPTLISLIKSEEMYDPLFPGYGYAPYLALLCLGKIKDPSSIIPIFETLSKESLFGEEAAVAALIEMGEKSKKFLLDLIASRPITQDNTTAAFALSAFPPDAEIARACFNELKDPKVRMDALLSDYLLTSCDALSQLPEKEEFINISRNSNLRPELKSEMERMIREWEK